MERACAGSRGTPAASRLPLAPNSSSVTSGQPTGEPPPAAPSAGRAWNEGAEPLSLPGSAAAAWEAGLASAACSAGGAARGQRMRRRMPAAPPAGCMAAGRNPPSGGVTPSAGCPALRLSSWCLMNCSRGAVAGQMSAVRCSPHVGGGTDGGGRRDPGWTCGTRAAAAGEQNMVCAPALCSRWGPAWCCRGAGQGAVVQSSPQGQRRCVSLILHLLVVGSGGSSAADELLRLTPPTPPPGAAPGAARPPPPNIHAAVFSLQYSQRARRANMDGGDSMEES